MRFLKLTLTIIVCFWGLQYSAAQQQSMFTQYMFNALAINPAYTGTQEAIVATALARQQWVGVDGAPNTETFYIHSPINETNLGLGFSAMHDQIGVSNQYGVFFSTAYRLPLGDGKRLSFGLQGGLSYYGENLSQVVADDQTFLSGDLSSFLPSFSAGLYYYTRRFYAGVSIPQLNNFSVDTPNSLLSATTKLVRHYFIASGYVFDINRDLRLKPNILVKMVPGAPLEVDLNANLLIKDTFWVGLSWRSLESLDLITQVNITKSLSFGYAYDLALGSQISRMGSGSHEVMVSYRFSLDKTKFITPRHFF
ncbi:type IX secretion system membrane protein PorP/SprF [Algivirga pacifica]|uniref:Type IX secretion system membrane protein PorP/SprF n=1 Tax=Algivirga pacifica TaxID=1162670 RepID=A0ABP9DJS0_9BACT